MKEEKGECLQNANTPSGLQRQQQGESKESNPHNQFRRRNNKSLSRVVNWCPAVALHSPVSLHEILLHECVVQPSFRQCLSRPGGRTERG